MQDKTSNKANKCCSASSALHREKYSALLRLCLSYSRRALTFLSSEALGSCSCIGSSMRELVFVCGRVCLRVTHPEGILAVTSRRDPSHTTWFSHIHMLLCPLLGTSASDSCVCRSTIWLIIVSLPSFASSFPQSVVTLAVMIGFLVFRCLISSTFLPFLPPSFLTLHNKPRLHSWLDALSSFSSASYLLFFSFLPVFFLLQ